MKAKQFIPLLVVCAVVCLGGWLVMEQNRADWNDAQSVEGVVDIVTDPNALLLPDFPLNDIQRVVVTSKENTVTLAKVDKTWGVASQHGYPADFSKIADFLKKVADLQAGHVMSIGENRYGRLELNLPDKEEQTGTLVEFFNKSDGLVEKLVLGKQMTSKPSGEGSQQYGGYPVGRYILTQSGTVAQVKESFSSVSDNSDGWIDTAFFQVDKLKSGIAYLGDSMLWQVARDTENGDITYRSDVPEGRELDTTKVTQVDSTLKSPRFKSIADPAASDEELGFTAGRRFVAETFDNATYTISIGSKNGTGDYPVRVKVDYIAPPAPDAPAEETPEAKAERETKHAESVAEATHKYEQDQARYGAWTYLVYSYSVDELLFQAADFLKELESEKPEGEGDGDDDGGPSFGPPIPFAP